MTPVLRAVSPGRDVQALAAAFAREFAGRADENDRAGRFPIENYRRLHEAGFLTLSAPEALGGGGARVPEMVQALETLAAGDGATALVTAMSVSLLGRVHDQKAWPEDVLAGIVRDLVAEGGTINTCVTEPELGSISRGGVPGTSAVAAPGGWRISGRKIFVTGAPAARYLVTAIVLPPDEAAPKGTVASALVRGDAPGVTMQDTWSQSMSLRTCGNFDVIYDDVFVPDTLVVDRRAVGAPLPPGRRPGADGWALVIAAVYLGIGQAALDAACDYANGRVPSALGRPIAEQPHIQQWIGDMQVALAGARAVLRAAAAHAEAGMEAGALAAEIATAKFLCTNAACQATERALRVAGGFSLTRSLPLERYFRDARAGLFQPPQDDLALGLIGRTALAARREAAC
jgi:alkylation response protein AidB-like acyl-CoA dehydrogenase